MLHRFNAYEKAAEQVTVAQASLMSKVNAAAEIDRVLTQCITLVGIRQLGRTGVS